MDDIESKRVTIVACSTDKIKSKSVHEMYISVDTRKLKDKKDEEPLVTDISLIKAPGYSKLF